MTTSKHFTVIYSVITGILGGILATFFFMNFFETHWPSTGFSYLPLISLSVFLIMLLILLQGLAAKEKLIRILIFIPIYLVLHYSALIAIMTWAFSKAGSQGAIF